ncbi:MAG: fused MFS/spermidine synthase [Mariprofundaceae bacterium]|nr:fused MFS/spermidine synthase [Mariprofundaceae bacterium]
MMQRNHDYPLANRSSARWLLLLYATAGVTALAYQVLWSRMLGVLFGASTVAVVITVSAFMLGLGLGSVVGSKKRSIQSFPLLLGLIAGVELLVACYALMLPWLSSTLFGWRIWFGSWDLLISYGLAAFMLFVPATLLGFAFPLAVRAGSCCGIQLHRLYGWNAAGGAAGALLPLLLLPLLGWSSALQAVAMLGLLLAAGFAIVGYRAKVAAHHETAVSLARPPLSYLLSYAAIGSGAMMLEIVWIRMYGMVLLRTEYVMAMIITVFLLGIALGSLMAARLPRALVLRLMPLVVLLCGIVGLLLLPALSTWVHQWQFNSLFVALLAQTAVLTVLTAPVTLALGAWLPLLMRDDDGQILWDGAWLYGVNSVGAFIGGMLAGFVLIPWLGSAMSWLFAVLLIAASGCYWGAQRWQRLALVMIIALPMMLWKGDFPAVASLLPSEFAGTTQLRLHEDALSITHVLAQADGQRVLLADLQRLDASTEPTAVAVQRNEARLPMMLHGEAKQVLFLGLGTGITAAAALAWADAHVTAVELSAGAITAASHDFVRSNHHVADHITMIHDDARRYLMQTDLPAYDVIVGDLFHPDLVGRAQLLSRQQFQRARNHLSDSGLFCQWLALNQFDALTLQVVLRTFAQVFPNNAVFIDGFRLGMVGYVGAQPQAQVLLKQWQDFDSEQREQAFGSETAWTWLSRYGGTAQSLLQQQQGRVQDEWWPVIEYVLPQMHYGDSTLPQLLQQLLRQRPDWQHAAADFHVATAEREAFKRAWFANTLLMRGQLLEIAPSSQAPDPMRLFNMAYRAAPDNRWAAFAVADAMYNSLAAGPPPNMTIKEALQKILSIRPDHERALRRLLQLAKNEGDEVLAQQCKRRWDSISPYHQ